MLQSLQGPCLSRCGSGSFQESKLRALTAMFGHMQIGLHMTKDGTVDTSKFKVVYVAPMKALVAEMVGNFSKRLEKCAPPCCDDCCSVVPRQLACQKLAC